MLTDVGTHVNLKAEHINYELEVELGAVNTVTVTANPAIDNAVIDMHVRGTYTMNV